jgi:para-aminobenzoate synthetase component 1
LNTANVAFMESDWIALANRLGSAGTPFLALIDFEMRHPLVIPLSSLDSRRLHFDFRGRTNRPDDPRRITANRMGDTIPNPRFISSMDYSTAFRHVRAEQIAGNSVLANLTFPSEICPEGDYDLNRLFGAADAPYRLWADLSGLRNDLRRNPADELIPPPVSPLPDEILFFSPESFVCTRSERMYTFPMKGTALVPSGANRAAVEKLLLADEKERAEHTTVVDLLRNDLGRVCSDIRVEKFRYVSSIDVIDGELLQISSRISGALPRRWREAIGSVISELLPAGSVSGAPKRETCRIIAEAESMKRTMGEATGNPGVPGADILPPGRGYYTGVAALFDGAELDSAVMIRFIERHGRRWFFRSGGGVTIYSDELSEYRELMDKVRLPVARGRFETSAATLAAAVADASPAEATAGKAGS